MTFLTRYSYAVAYGRVVVCQSSVRLYVTDVLWLRDKSYERNFCTNNYPCINGFPVQNLGIQCKQHIFKFGVEWKSKKNQRFQCKTGHISETARDRAKVTINH